MRHRWTGLVALGLLTAASTASAGDTRARDPDGLLDARALAGRIDYWLGVRQAARVAAPAPIADDAEFIRRAYLDLAGCVPPLIDARDFVDDRRPDKRFIWVEMLLDGRRPSRKPDAFTSHFTNVWRAWLLSRVDAEQAAALGPETERWLQNRLKDNLPYDRLVRQLIAETPAGPDNMPAIRRRRRGGGGAQPRLFDQINESKPENLAGATSRLFLGIKLECAQCHNDRSGGNWSQTEFWSFAAFFGGQRNQGDDQLTIGIPGKNKVVRARFLQGPEPAWKPGDNAREMVADWLVSPTNPYFARAGVNRIWSYFFGIGLIDPVDEQGDHNLPSHPELLDELARQFTDHGFDLKYLIRAIVASRAYQRTSAISSPIKEDPRLFGRMNVRGLSAEQLFDSLAEVTEFENASRGVVGRLNDGTNLTPRQQFVTRFAHQYKPTETPTSILQALYLMNSPFIADRTSLEHNNTLKTLAGQRTSHARRIETLFLVVLSRKPTTTELNQCVAYLDRGGSFDDHRQALADVFWALINSAEFGVNH
jgi:Protein of unknown function (DUF1553)/Protein of unknown function (DUF1549)